VLTSFAVDEALQQHQLAFGMLRACSASMCCASLCAKQAPQTTAAPRGKEHIEKVSFLGRNVSSALAHGQPT
jgi:hypothetical protein